MTKFRLMFLIVDAILVAGIALVLWLPLPDIGRRAPEAAPQQAAPASLPHRSIPAPDLEQSFFRRGPHDAQNSEPEEAPAAPDIRLVGALVSDETRMALIERPNSPVQRLQEGDDVDGWILTGIEPQSITLTGQGQTAVYSLDPGTGPQEIQETQGLQESEDFEEPGAEIADDERSQGETSEPQQDPL